MRWAIEHRWVAPGVGVAGLCVALFLAFGPSLAVSFCLTSMKAPSGLVARSRPVQVSRKALVLRPRRRHIFASFPEVTNVVSEVGRPDDGTDTGGFGNTEYFVDLKPKEQWRPVFHQDKDELIAAMNRGVAKLPGAFWNFSQPIEDNVNETVTGTKGGSRQDFRQ